MASSTSPSSVETGEIQAVKMKIHNGDHVECIKIQLSQIIGGNGDASYEKLLVLAMRSLDISMTYVDEEGDVVTIKSSKELAFAMRQNSHQPYLRLSVGEKKNLYKEEEKEGRTSNRVVLKFQGNHAIEDEVDDEGGNDDDDEGKNDDEGKYRDDDDTSAVHENLDNDGAEDVEENEEEEEDLGVEDEGFQDLFWKPYGIGVPFKPSVYYDSRCVSLSSDGSIMAIGSPEDDQCGSVRVYKRLNGSWKQMGKAIVGNEGDSFGYSVSLSSNGRVLAVGIPERNEKLGCVRVFKFEKKNWLQCGSDIVGKADGDNCGNFVSLSSDGSIVAIGSPYRPYNGEFRGCVDIYEFKQEGWMQRGDSIFGKEVHDECGKSVSLSSDGSVVAIGSPGGNEGNVRVYKYKSTGSWTKQGDDFVGGKGFGYSVHLSSDGAILAIGTPYDSHGVRVFEYSCFKGWAQCGEDIFVNTDDGRASCVSLSSDGKVLAIGSSGEDFDPRCRGRVGVFKYTTDGGWVTIGSDIIGMTANDYCGSQVALTSDGKSMAVGSPRGDSNGTVNVFNLTVDE